MTTDVSASTIAGLIDDGKSRSFAWSASLIAATTAVHHPDQWDGLIDVMGDKAAAAGYQQCTHTKEALCKACAYLRSEFDRQWTQKAELGTHVHHLALSWASGEPIETTPDIDPYIDSLEAFYATYNPEWIVTERTVAYRRNTHQAYVGQIDGIARIDCPLCTPGARCAWILDFKTGRFSPLEQTLQLAGYRFAQHLTTWVPVEGKRWRCRKVDGCDDPVPHDHCGYCGLAEQHRPYSRPSYYTERVDGAVPPVAHAGVILLAPEHHGRLVELPANGDAHAVFLRMRDAWNFARRIKQWEKDNPIAAHEKEGVAA